MAGKKSLKEPVCVCADIEEWANAWGHTVKVGEKKTAAMYFPVPGAKPLPNPTPVITLASGMVVPWVQTYKYRHLN